MHEKEHRELEGYTQGHFQPNLFIFQMRKLSEMQRKWFSQCNEIGKGGRKRREKASLRSAPRTPRRASAACDKDEQSPVRTIPFALMSTGSPELGERIQRRWKRDANGHRHPMFSSWHHTKNFESMGTLYLKDIMLIKLSSASPDTPSQSEVSWVPLWDNAWGCHGSLPAAQKPRGKRGSPWTPASFLEHLERRRRLRMLDAWTHVFGPDDRCLHTSYTGSLQG